MDSIRAQILSDGPPIDVAALLRRCLGRAEIADRILQKFRLALADDVPRLEQAILASDAESIAHLAHRIRGACLSVAANSLCDHARRIEACAAAGLLGGIPEHFEQLQGETARVLAHAATSLTEDAAC